MHTCPEHIGFCCRSVSQLMLDLAEQKTRFEPKFSGAAALLIVLKALCCSMQCLQQNSVERQALLPHASNHAARVLPIFVLWSCFCSGSHIRACPSSIKVTTTTPHCLWQEFSQQSQGDPGARDLTAIWSCSAMLAPQERVTSPNNKVVPPALGQNGASPL